MYVVKRIFVFFDVTESKVREMQLREQIDYTGQVRRIVVREKSVIIVSFVEKRRRNRQ